MVNILSVKKADMKIQQMTFMILFVFIFFAVAGLFFLSIQSSKITQTFNLLQKETAVSSMQSIANMPELNCDPSRSFCIDQDKIMVFAGDSKSYGDFWPVASIKVRKAYPKMERDIKCPATNCTYYEIYNSGQKNIQEYGIFVSICKKIKSEGVIQEECEIGKLSVGVKIAA
jgi:hypothetical protein